MGGDLAETRRRFLCAAVVAGVASAAVSLAVEPGKKAESSEEDVDPPEDLMREHGVLKRVMLIYDEIVRRIEANRPFPPQALSDAAHVIRTFVEDYHEKLEENYLFPRFEKAGKLVDLVTVLRAQHDAGRKLTDVIGDRANAAMLQKPEERRRVVEAVRAFNRMYAPHEAREDTVLFPAIRSVFTEKEFETLGDEFEKQENQLFGEHGFEKMVDRVAGIEKTVGIYELAQFTP